MFKKLAVLLLTGLMLTSLVACSKKEEPKPEEDKPTVVTLKVWGSQEDQTLLNDLVEEFKAAHPETTYDITFGVVGEPDAKQKVLEDPAAAADVFAFPNDQVKDLLAAGALYEVTRNKDAIIAANSAGSVGSATIDGALYGYPMSADNGYFLYYDAASLTEKDVATFEALLDAAQAQGKKVFMDVSNGWYIASFFMGAGGELGIDENGNQTCNFNGEAGLKAAEAVKYVTAHPAFITGDDAVLKAGIADGSIVAGVSGAWNALDIEGSLGEGYAATKLPEVNGYQMSSFAGFKLIGVNSLTKHPVEAMELAEFLTNESSQAKRFEVRGIGPSNVNVAASAAVQENKALAALSLQSQFAVSQNDVLGNYWVPAEAFGTVMENKDYSKDVQTLLDEMVAQIVAK